SSQNKQKNHDSCLSVQNISLSGHISGLSEKGRGARTPARVFFTCPVYPAWHLKTVLQLFMYPVKTILTKQFRSTLRKLQRIAAGLGIRRQLLAHFNKALFCLRTVLTQKPALAGPAVKLQIDIIGFFDHTIFPLIRVCCPWCRRS